MFAVFVFLLSDIHRFWCFAAGLLTFFLLRSPRRRFYLVIQGGTFEGRAAALVFQVAVSSELKSILKGQRQVQLISIVLCDSTVTCIWYDMIHAYVQMWSTSRPPQVVEASSCWDCCRHFVLPERTFDPKVAVDVQDRQTFFRWCRWPWRCWAAWADWCCLVILLRALKMRSMPLADFDSTEQDKFVNNVALLPGALDTRKVTQIREPFDLKGIDFSSQSFLSFERGTKEAPAEVGHQHGSNQDCAGAVQGDDVGSKVFSLWLKTHENVWRTLSTVQKANENISWMAVFWQAQVAAQGGRLLESFEMLQAWERWLREKAGQDVRERGRAERSRAGKCGAGRIPTVPPKWRAVWSRAIPNISKCSF